MARNQVKMQVGYAVSHYKGIYVLGVQFLDEGAAQAGDQSAYSLGFRICQISQARRVTTEINEAVTQISTATRPWRLVTGID